MQTTEQHPTNIEFEIDRKRLMPYWQIQGFAGCCAPGMLGGFFIMVTLFEDYLTGHRHSSFGHLYLVRLAGLGVAAIIGLVLGLLLYFVMAHYPAKWAATNLRLIVEGPYLRIVSGAIFVTDRRIHFRAISDYSTQHGPLLKWLGMKTLAFNIIGSSHVASTKVPGVVDAE